MPEQYGLSLRATMRKLAMCRASNKLCVAPAHSASRPHIRYPLYPSFLRKQESRFASTLPRSSKRDASLRWHDGRGTRCPDKVCPSLTVRRPAQQDLGRWTPTNMFRGSLHSHLRMREEWGRRHVLLTFIIAGREPAILLAIAQRMPGSSPGMMRKCREAPNGTLDIIPIFC